MSVYYDQKIHEKLKEKFKYFHFIKNKINKTKTPLKIETDNSI